MRHTSIDAYNHIKDCGLLSRTRWLVYETLFQKGPCTARELDKWLATPGDTKTSYHKRLSELERMGVVQTVGERPCSMTGVNATLWDVTDRLPIKYEKKMPMYQKYRALVVKAIDTLRRNEMLGAAQELEFEINELDSAGR